MNLVIINYYLSKSPVIVSEHHFVNGNKKYPDFNRETTEVNSNSEYFIGCVFRFRFILFEYVHRYKIRNKGSDNTYQSNTSQCNITDVCIHV